MLIASAWSGHDCSYTVFENGMPIIHNEMERFNREKESPGDGIKFLLDTFDRCDEIKYFTTCFPTSKITNYNESFEKIKSIVEKNNGEIIAVGHHLSHAANAFFSSKLKNAMIITLDGGGVESNNFVTAATIWKGEENKIQHIHTFPLNSFNIGGVWTRATRYVFNLQSGWPRGHQAGSVMAMAALGDREKYKKDFLKMIVDPKTNFMYTQKPKDQPKGPNVGTDPKHPYLNKYRIIADSSEEERFNLAAGLQAATEEVLEIHLKNIIKQFPTENICLAGGVTLNCVAIGKIKKWIPEIKNVYIPPTPHDGGLPLGSAQYVWHQLLDEKRIDWKDNFTPYLGKTYTEEEVQETIKTFDQKINFKKVNDDKVLELLLKQKIVAVFGKGSESGRRALGNRSILADPRSQKMKELINEKVKHRQWYRPFAPSILRESVSDWFERDDDSPYMNIVLKFKEEKKSQVPAVVHFDDTARIQSVTENDNEWYYRFIKEWESKSGVPIILNTSFNDREPICETPKHAIDCFLRTEIDYLYFYDYKILVSKN